MGNISSCCFPNKNEDEINERTHILDNPIGGQSLDNNYGNEFSINSNNQGINSYGSTTNGLRSEQNQLNSTLHKLVSKVIDVSSIDSNLLIGSEQNQDWNERQRLYCQRLNQLSKNKFILKSKFIQNQNSNQLLVSNQNKNLITNEIISEENIQLINYFCEKSLNAIKNGFQIHCNESFVVQFDP